MICERCGAVINDGDMFCGECGFAVGAFRSEPTMGARCANCGNPIVAGELFCSECGTPTGAAASTAVFGGSKRCPNCGAVCEEDGDFCGECGQRLASSPASAPVMPGRDFLPLDNFDPDKTVSFADSASIPTPVSMPTPPSTVESVPSAESISGGMKSTFDRADKPMHYEGEEEGRRFFKQPGELE